MLQKLQQHKADTQQEDHINVKVTMKIVHVQLCVVWKICTKFQRISQVGLLCADKVIQTDGWTDRRTGWFQYILPSNIR